MTINPFDLAKSAMGAFCASNEKNFFCLCLMLICISALAVSAPAFAKEPISADFAHKTATISDGDGRLGLRLNYGSGCSLEQINVFGREVAGAEAASTGIRIGDKRFSSRDASGTTIKIGKNSVEVSGIRFGDSQNAITETWIFTPEPHTIVWQITRKYSSVQTADDTAFPQWNFKDMAVWTGGMLDNGGVVWNKYLDSPGATYGAHFGAVTFWNGKSNDCLRITPSLPGGWFGAGRFSRQKSGIFTFDYAIADRNFVSKRDQYRFLGDREDLWGSFTTRPSVVTAKFTIQALEYDKTYNRGSFAGLNGNDIRDLFNTVARYGVIDSHLVGGNGWRSGYICLHEPFFGQIAAALDEEDYTKNFAAALDFTQAHAIGADGRVKSRWAYGPYDNMPKTYDQYGFYEAQWGYLLDSQPDYVMNVAEEYDLTGDKKWLAGHKNSCERALDFLLRREVGRSGLVAMMTDSEKRQRGSDWIDIVWASYENALINAQLYAALNLWAGAEEDLGDAVKAESYREFAARLKESFNRPASEGGFWDPDNKWYVHWRDEDGSIHGDNLVTAVNFAAIAYGLCDDPVRQKAILDRIEAEMNKEKLFYWPLCFFSYKPDEAKESNFPFPTYENGDIFLSWGELGVRAYCEYDPTLALKYVKSTLARYDRDGLSFQRYLRKSQEGAGNDILAGNCMPIVGLYRDIYGIQPKPNRLYLDPHLTAELSGTKLRYTLRNKLYEIDLSPNSYGVAAGNWKIADSHPFGVSDTGKEAQYFHGASAKCSMSVSPAKNMLLSVSIEKWTDAAGGAREWTESARQNGGKIDHALSGLAPNALYRLSIDGKSEKSLRADKAGQIEFQQKLGSRQAVRFELAAQKNRKG